MLIGAVSTAFDTEHKVLKGTLLANWLPFQLPVSSCFPEPCLDTLDTALQPTLQIDLRVQ